MSAKIDRASYGQDAATMVENFCRARRKSSAKDDNKTSRSKVNKGVSLFIHYISIKVDT